MYPKSALPAMATGLVGLCCGVVSNMSDNGALALIAGILALASGFTVLGTTYKTNARNQLQKVIEQELARVKAQSAETHSELEMMKKAIEEPGDSLDSRDLVLDSATGLFSQQFFEVALDSRIAFARRHLKPVSYVLLSVSERDPQTKKLSPSDFAAVSEVIISTIRDSDTACRIANSDQYSLLLEDTPETGAVWTAERIRAALVEKNPNLVLWAGVSSYPSHAFSSSEMAETAADAIKLAKDWDQGRVEVAKASSEEEKNRP